MEGENEYNIPNGEGSNIVRDDSANENEEEEDFLINGNDILGKIIV